MTDSITDLGIGGYPDDDPAPLDDGLPRSNVRTARSPDSPGRGLRLRGEHVADRRETRGTGRRVRARLIDVLAFLVLYVAVLAPNRLDDLTPWVFVRLPIEMIAAAAVLLLLPRRPGRVLALIAGAVVGLLTIGKIIDMGFYEVLVRPFDPVLDGVLVSDGVEFLDESVGRAAAVAAVVAAVLLTVALVTATALAALRLSRVPVLRRDVAVRTVAALAALWVGLAALGVDVAPHQPLAARSAAVPAYDRAQQVAASLKDKAAFAQQERVDAFAPTPSSQLLTALRGKNVILAFVESYGRSAVQDPGLAPTVVPVLQAGTARLRAAGFTAKSGFLTSPTFGSGSVYAHSTLASGLWVSNEQRYRTLVSSDRFTLDVAFKRAGWRTAGVMPAVTRAWPEGSFYGFDTIYNSHQLGYQGPHFSWAPMPDQYALAAMQSREFAGPGHPPVFAEIVLVSSHAPWAPLPTMVGWNQLGNGSVFGPIAAAGTKPSAIWPDAAKVRAAYAQSIAYSLNALISYVLTYGDKNTVLVFLGDHQPAPIVTGESASHDVPISIVARDPAVLARISDWGWQDGLRPAPSSPVWPMNAFRDRFLTAFGPGGGTGPEAASAPAAGRDAAARRARSGTSGG